MSKINRYFFPYHCLNREFSSVMINGCKFGFQVPSWSQLKLDPYNLLLWKWSAPSIALGSTWVLLSCFFFTWDELDQRWSLAAISGLELVNLHFPVLKRLKMVYSVLWRMGRHSPHCSLFSTDTSIYYYLIATSMANVQAIFIP